MAKNNDFRSDIEAIRAARETTVEEVPYFAAGNIYSDHRGTEYQMLKLIPSRGIDRAELLRLKDGVTVSGSVAALNPTTGRVPTAADEKVIAGWAEKIAEAKKTLVPGQVVKLTDQRSRTAAAKSFPGKQDGNFVVVKVSEKTANIVPLGGHGDGMAYLRVSPGLVTVVEL